MPYPTPTSTSNYLEDGASAVTTSRYGAYGGSPRVFDTGSSLIAWPGIVVASFTAMDTTSGNENYQLKIFGNTAADFSGTNMELFSVSLAALPTNNEQAYNFSNQADGTIYRYLRAQIVANGTTPSVTVDIWVLHVDDLDDMTLAQLTKFMSIAAQRLGDASRSFSEWAGGTVDGGPESDGRYPLYDGNDTTYLVPCPAKIAASAGLSYEAFIALTEETLPFGDVPGPDVMIATSGTLKRGKLFLFAARRTQDLEPIATLISDELIPSVKASNGLERKIALGEIMRQTMGMVNPLRYGVIPDCRSNRHGFSMESGDDVVECNEALFSSHYVGKHIQIGGALGGGTAGKGTILEYLDSTHVRVSFTATADISGQDGNFGTLNTPAMQNAIVACFNPYGTYNFGSILMLPDGKILTGGLYYLPRMGIVGHGVRQSMLVRYDDSYMTGVGEFPRYDGDVTPYPISKYQDNSYYYPVYPNAYKAPYYAGSYVPEIAPTLCNRLGTDRYGDTWPVNDSAAGAAAFGYKVDSDFNVFNDFSMDGSRYNSTRLMPGFEFRGGLFGLDINGENFAAPYNQVDPYLRMRDIEFHLHAGIPFATFGQCSAIITGIGSYENGACGYFHRAFDCNISNGYFMGNNGPGIVAAGTNTNWTTMKISFNGDGSYGWLWGTFESKANLYIPGIGHNWNNFRAQESYGSNVLVYGRGNDFTGCHFDDTGCVYPKHIALDNPTTIAANMNFITPVIAIGQDADDLRLNDCGFGGLVHVGENYASHAVFWMGSGAERTSGRLYSKDVGPSDYFDSGNAAISGVYEANEWGAEASGVAPATANLTLDGVDITTL